MTCCLAKVRQTIKMGAENVVCSEITLYMLGINCYCLVGGMLYEETFQGLLF